MTLPERQLLLTMADLATIRPRALKAKPSLPLVRYCGNALQLFCLNHSLEPAYLRIVG